MSITEDLKEAEDKLKEFGMVISRLANPNELNELHDQMNLLESDTDRKLKEHEIETSKQQHFVHELEAEAETLSVKINSHKKSINLLKDELSHLWKEREVLKNVPDGDVMTAKIKELEAEDLMFRKHLGMEIRKVKGGCLQIAFSQIDHKQPNSLFLFSLHLDENRQYVVSNCKPSIPDVDDIVKVLNSNNDFHKFMHTMRRKFKLGST